MTAAMAERSALTEKNDSDNGLIDPQLWHACAGSQVRIPQVGSSVIYFPQGHAEHAASLPEFPVGFSSSTIVCHVLSVKFLADRETDEVYARIALHPENPIPHPSSMFDPPSPPQSCNPTKIASFAKTLTQSDANNGGGFSVPRYCAETIFPRLDYSKDPPVQIVLAKDVHGNVWKFRHIYRGTPRRHLLTTGWSNFVNQKKLVAGDAIVFLRSGSGEICVGVRRSTKGMGGCDSAFPWRQLHSSIAASPAARSLNWDGKSVERNHTFLDNCSASSLLISSKTDFPLPMNNFARNRARVTAKSVVEAATLAASGKAFEVIFYPRTTIAEFCVQAHAVRMSLHQNWAPGIRFKMAVETEDASRISWFMGTVSRVQDADPALWPNSPWKMLQVTWDEPDLLQGITRVSPWQVELVSPVQLPPFAFSKKKVRLSQPVDLLLDARECLGMSTGTVINGMPGDMNPWHGYFENVPAGMQGARHEGNYGLSFQAPKFRSTGLLLNNIYQQQECSPTNEIMPKVSSKVSVIDFFQQGYVDMQSSPVTTPKSSNSNENNSHSQLSSTGIASCNGGGALGRKKASFLLFGKTIDAFQPSNPQQPQVSSDSSRHDAISDGFKSDVCDDSHRFISDQGNVLHPLKNSSMLFHTAASSFDGLGSLKLCNDQSSYLNRSVEDSGYQHCKVYSESDDVGRTVDLSNIGSYQQLYEALENMFGAKKSDFLNRVVCIDSMGFSRPIGNEPYWDFMNRAKRLKILTESSSENMAK